MAKAKALTTSTAHVYYGVFARECSAAAFESAIQLVLSYGIAGALEELAQARTQRGELPAIVITRMGVEYIAERLCGEEPEVRLLRGLLAGTNIEIFDRRVRSARSSRL